MISDGLHAANKRDHTVWIVDTIILIAGITLIVILCLRVGSDAPSINQCGDSVRVTYADDGTLYGDQNGDGVLAGADCDWR